VSHLIPTVNRRPSVRVSNNRSVTSPTSGPSSPTLGHRRSIIAKENTNAKFTLFHDPNKEDSNKVAQLVRSMLPEEEYEIVTRPLQEHELKRMMHLMDEHQWDQLCNQSLDPKELHQLNKGDMSILIKKLTGERGLAALARPILICPIYGSIVIGYDQDGVTETLSGSLLW
jgi:arsenate reductase-like glutaredoxin family protein